MIEFQAWPKTPRLSNGGVTVTEKIDGTNACVIIMPVDIDAPGYQKDPMTALGGWQENNNHLVGAQSRKRLIRPNALGGPDNAGFAAWVWSHANELVDLLGPGRHFGEWWGQGIQRRYGMDHKVFSLFNEYKWNKIAEQREDWRPRAQAIHMDIVPLLYQGRFSDVAIEDTLSVLREHGSFAPLKWGKSGQKAEGVIIRLPGGQLFKAFVEDDDVPKSLQVDHVNSIIGQVNGTVVQAGDIQGLQL